MKKIILITIIIFAIPHFGFAQGPYVSTSIEGTLWRAQLRGVLVSVGPFSIERETQNMLFGFSDGLMYQCMITDAETCTPYLLPEEMQPVIMPALGLVMLSFRDDSHGWESVTHAMLYLPPWGLGFINAVGRTWAGEEPKASMGSMSGLLVREAEDWTP
jgi:hypothetical protein